MKSQKTSSKPENGLYVAKVTDEGTTTMHADEDAVCDHQTAKIFKDRDQNRADQEQDASDKKRDAEDQQRKADRQTAKRKRQRWCMAKDVLGLLGAALLVYSTYRWGLLVAIGSIVGCCVAAVCRVTGYIEKENNHF